MLPCKDNVFPEKTIRIPEKTFPAILVYLHIFSYLRSVFIPTEMRNLLIRIFIHRWRWWLAATIILLTAAATMWRCWPSNEHTIRRSAAVVECRSWYEACTEDHTLFYFQSLQADSLPCHAALRRDSAWQVSRTAGCWVHRWPVIPSCLGRLVTANTDTASAIAGNGRQVLNACLQAMQRRIATLQTESDELNYFLRVHGVQDEGFPMIADYEERVSSELHTLKRILERIDSLPPSQPVHLRHKAEYMVYFRDLKGKLHTRPCARRSVSADGRIALLQTGLRITPLGAHAQTIMPWAPSTSGDILATAHGGLAEPTLAEVKTKPQIVPGHLHQAHHDLPRILVADGEPLFTTDGRFIGISVDGQLVGRDQISSLFH